MNIEIPIYKFALTSELVVNCEGTKFKPEDFLPTRSEKMATGWDVRCADLNGIDLKAECYYKIPLGIRSLPPEGWWMELEPRSSTFIKRNFHALSGKIDETFSHQILLVGQYIQDSCEISNRNHLKRIEFGDKIGQLIPVKRQEMVVEKTSNDELDKEHVRRDSGRTGGFGSTGVS